MGTPVRVSLPSLQHFHFLCYEQRSKGPNFSLDFKKRLIRFQIPQNSAPQTPSGAEESVSSQAYQLAGFQPKPTQPSFQSQSHPSGFSLPRTEHLSKRELPQKGTRGNPETSVARGDEDSSGGVGAPAGARALHAQPFQPSVRVKGTADSKTSQNQPRSSWNPFQDKRTAATWAALC